MNGHRPIRSADCDADIARLRAYMAYSGLSIRAVAKAAGMSRMAVEKINFPDRFNPRLTTLRRLVAIIPAEFSERGAASEYQESRERVRAWFEASGLKRYQLEPLGIQYEWVQHIGNDDWAPSWFVLRKILALIEQERPKVAQ